MTDADRKAAATVVQILLRNGLHIRSADAPVVANEIVQALRGHGWRPTPAQPAPAWEPGSSRPLPAKTVHAIAAKARAAITNPLNHLDPDGGLD